MTKRPATGPTPDRDSPKKEVKVEVFGTYLKSLREGLRRPRTVSVETIVRHLRQLGITIDDTALRGYEYGWTERPDPIVLEGLARVYKTDLSLILAVLKANRQNKHMSEFELERVLREAAERSHVQTAAADRLAEIKERLRQIRADITELCGEVRDPQEPGGSPPTSSQTVSPGDLRDRR